MWVLILEYKSSQNSFILGCDTGFMKTIGFDFDMTLVNSDLGLLATLAEMFPKRVEMSNTQILSLISGLPIREILLKFSDLESLDKNLETFFALYPTFGPPNSVLMPGALQALEAVKSAGLRSVIISAKSSENLDLMMKHFGMKNYPRYGDCFGIKKSEAILDCGAILYIGDQESDVDAAHESRIQAIRLIGSKSDIHSRADWTLPSLEFFPAWLRDEFRNV